MNSSIRAALLSDGCLVQEGAVLERCIIGVRSLIGKQAVVRDSIVIGADRYETDEQRARTTPAQPALGIGEGASIHRAIVDKNARIGKRVRIHNEKQLQEFDCPLYSIRDGIVVIAKDTVIPDGMVI